MYPHQQNFPNTSIIFFRMDVLNYLDSHNISLDQIIEEYPQFEALWKELFFEKGVRPVSTSLLVHYYHDHKRETKKSIAETFNRSVSTIYKHLSKYRPQDFIPTQADHKLFHHRHELAFTNKIKIK